MTANWENGSLDPAREMLADPWFLPGLSDGGTPPVPRWSPGGASR
ncbi:MAG TPA: hypothetical protein VJ870_20100 [Amycolatopsis sp.]|nr:hypothetical protein [Amycolatopsis sp.]